MGQTGPGRVTVAVTVVSSVAVVVFDIVTPDKNSNLYYTIFHKVFLSRHTETFLLKISTHLIIFFHCSPSKFFVEYFINFSGNQKRNDDENIF